MNPFEFVISVIVIVGIFSIIRARMGIRNRWVGTDDGRSESAENARLNQQVEKLQERIRILERIVTDRGAETAAQIEALRDHDRIEEEDKA